MNPVGVLYTALILAVVVYILVRGRSEERVVVVTLLLGSISTFLIYVYLGRNFTGLPLPMLINESAVLSVLLTIAFRSKRFWPIPVAAFQMAAFLTLLTPYFGENIVSRGLGVSQGIWAYLQLIVLVFATWRGRRNLSAEHANSSPN